MVRRVQKRIQLFSVGRAQRNKHPNEETQQPKCGGRSAQKRSRTVSQNEEKTTRANQLQQRAGPVAFRMRMDHAHPELRAKSLAARLRAWSIGNLLRWNHVPPA